MSVGSTRIMAVDGTGSITLAAGREGPRWSGEGRYLSYAVSTTNAFGGASNLGVAASLADGGSFHPAALVTSDVSANSIGNGYAAYCAMGRGYGSGVTFFGILGVAGLRLARRRNRKNAKA